MRKENCSAYFFGSIKVSHIAFIALLAYATGEDKKKIGSAVNEYWPIKDKEILYGYLKSYGGLKLDPDGELTLD